VRISADNDQSQTGLRKKWFWAASLVAGVVSFTVVGQLTRHAFTAMRAASPLAIDAMLQQAVNELKSGLPKRIDDATTLVDISHAGKEMTYVYEVDTRGRQIPSNFTAIARREVVPKVCGSRMKDGMARYGVSYVYRYNLPNGSRLGDFAVTASDCT
jgi:hypothetical protein